MESMSPSYSDEEECMDTDDSSSGEMEVEFEWESDGDRTIKIRYTIMTEEKIRDLQDELISETSTLVCVSRGQACTLLIQTNWDPIDVLRNWLADEDRIRDSVALSAGQESSDLDSQCKSCCQKIKIENPLSAPCGHHPFCRDCWRDYISASINNDGIGCLNLDCPEPGCKAIVGLDLVDLLSDYDKDVYYRYLLSSYVEANHDLKCCPAPGCGRVVRREPGFCGNFGVTCDCSREFCWGCLKENHHPIDCEVFDKWRKDNGADAEEIAWLVSYIKTCPKCLRNVDKTNLVSSNHMTCEVPCGFEFCWLCLGPWTNPHKCNNYEDESLEEKYLKAHVHFYERWESNHKCMEAARASLSSARNVADNWDWNRHGVTNHDWLVVIEALVRIVECRSMLKWSYAYGYYLYLNKTRDMEFIVYSQGEAEAAVNRLHHFVDTEMKRCLESDLPNDYLEDFGLKLMDLNYATGKYFENLVKAVNRGN